MIRLPTNITAGVEYGGNCTSESDMYLEVESSTEGCNVMAPKNASKHTIDFNITCEDKNDVYIATIECHSPVNVSKVNITGKIICWCFIIAIATVIWTVIPKPKITNKPANVTTTVGLPVTLLCYVEGDPNHYWVGWMYRDSIIQEGEKYAMSTSRSTRGTHHYLTIHTVEESGKYKCKVFTINGPVDQVSNEVTAENGMEHEILILCYISITDMTDYIQAPMSSKDQ